MKRLLTNERFLAAAVQFLTSRPFLTLVGVAIAVLAGQSVRLWGVWPVVFAVGACLSFVFGWNRAYAFWRKHGYVSKL